LGRLDREEKAALAYWGARSGQKKQRKIMRLELRRKQTGSTEKSGGIGSTRCDKRREERRGERRKLSDNKGERNASCEQRKRYSRQKNLEIVS